MLCLSIRDIKILIAYSSVVHIALIIFNLKILFPLSLAGRIIVMLAHGVCSSGLFAIANILYERSHSRAFILNKGLGEKAPYLLIRFFFLIRANFGGPFTFNLLGEVALILSLSLTNLGALMSVILLSFFSAAYSLLLFRSVSQGVRSPASTKHVGGRQREVFIVTCHVWPLVALSAAPVFF